MMIHSYIHKLYMNELIKELPIYMDKIYVKRIKIYTECIFSMMDGDRKEEPTSNRKVSNEIWKQSLLDHGNPLAQYV